MQFEGFEFVDRPEGLAAAIERMHGAKALAVDTEADSMHSFFEKVCLVQLATETGDAFVVDPLALRGLGGMGAVFADPATVKVFHGADFDVMSLRRDFAFEFRGIFGETLEHRWCCSRTARRTAVWRCTRPRGS